MLRTMSDRRGLRIGHLASLGGAVLAVASLWAPWYRVRLDLLHDALQARSAQLPAPVSGFAQQLEQLTALLPRSLSADAWLALHRLDALVAFAGGLTILALLAAGGALGPGIRVAGDAAARLALAAGAVTAVFVIGRIADPPGANVFIETRWGAWACLTGCIAMSAGAVLALTARAEPAPLVMTPIAAPAHDVSGSVAPPA